SWADMISYRSPDPSVQRTAGKPADTSSFKTDTDHTRPRTRFERAWRHRDPRYSSAKHWDASPRRTAPVSLRSCLGIGIGVGAMTALIATVGEDGSDPSGYGIAGLAFALPVLFGFVLWLLLAKRWRSRRLYRQGNAYRAQRRYGGGWA